MQGTRVLTQFYERGYCKNRDECTYAHGESDLRSMPVVPVDSYSPQTMVAPPRAPPPPVMAMYMVPVVPVPLPAMNPNLHLLTILQNMYQVFPGNAAVIKQLRRAEDLAYKSDFSQAS